MTLTIAKLIEMRDAEPFAIPCDRRIAYVDAIIDACAKVEDGGGGLLERHAMLLRFAAEWLDYTESTHTGACAPCRTGDVCDHGRFLESLSRDLRASDALPPGKGET